MGVSLDEGAEAGVLVASKPLAGEGAVASLCCACW